MSTTKTQLLKTIRAKCLDCVCGQPNEVKLCPTKKCPLWPYRMAKDPYKTPRQLTDAQKVSLAAGRRRLAESKNPL